MITDILISRTEGNICIHTATEADKDDYVALELGDDILKSLLKVGVEKEIDVPGIIWNERYESDCIMFAIVELSSGKTVGFCEIEHLSSSEPTIGIMLAEVYRGKGYGYLAAKMMIEEGWRLFNFPYFIWELIQDNIASKKLVLKLGGKLINHRCVLPDHVIKVMRENGIEVNPNDYPDSVERYKIDRPASFDK
jgi:predicted acetyltransferase